jgi:hypothetical protein
MGRTATVQALIGAGAGVNLQTTVGVFFMSMCKQAPTAFLHALLIDRLVDEIIVLPAFFLCQYCTYHL